MKCEICKEGPLTDGRAIYRTSPIGELPAHWRCKHHLTKAQLDSLDISVQEIIGVIEADNEKDKQ